MAVSIDTVYQRVLALANKEQRGYITPQEFNLFADHAQMELFEQYFYDLEQFERDVSSDIDSLIEQKIQIFKKEFGIIEHGYQIPNQLHKISYIYLHDNETENRVYLEKKEAGEFLKLKTGSLLYNSLTTPIYYVYDNKIHFAQKYIPGVSQTGTGNRYSYVMIGIEKPVTPEWAYVINGDNALYNPNLSVNFQLHSSEENELVTKILSLAGVAIKDLQLAQVAVGKEASTTQQQKQ